MRPLPLGLGWSTQRKVSPLPQDLDLHWQNLLESCCLGAHGKVSHCWHFIERQSKMGAKNIGRLWSPIHHPYSRSQILGVASSTQEPCATGTCAPKEAGSGETASSAGSKQHWRSFAPCWCLALDKASTLWEASAREALQVSGVYC